MNNLERKKIDIGSVDKYETPPEMLVSSENDLAELDGRIAEFKAYLLTLRKEMEEIGFSDIEISKFERLHEELIRDLERIRVKIEKNIMRFKSEIKATNN